MVNLTSEKWQPLTKREEWIVREWAHFTATVFVLALLIGGTIGWLIRGHFCG